MQCDNYRFSKESNKNLCFWYILWMKQKQSFQDSEEEGEEKVFKELTPVQSYSITDSFNPITNATTYDASTEFQELRQPVLDSVIPVSEINSISKRHQVSLVTSQLRPSLLKRKIHSKNVGNPLTNSNQEENNNLCAICNDKASGKHYGVLSCEGCKVYTHFVF